MHIAKVAHQIGTWAATMVAIAAFYIVFAIEHGDGLSEHAFIAAGFAALALLGTRFSPWMIVAALIGHGLFDAVVHLVLEDPSPMWWGPFCLGVDVVLGLWLAALLIQGKINPI